MTHLICGIDVFGALQHDRVFRFCHPTFTHAIWQEACQELVDVLGAERLNQRVTLKVFIETKLLVLRQQLDEHGWSYRLLKTYYPDMTDTTCPSFQLAVAIRRAHVHELIEELCDIEENPVVYLQDHQLTERDYFSSRQVTGGRFNEHTLSRWRKGTLTVADLLTSQPGTLLQNEVLTDLAPPFQRRTPRGRRSRSNSPS